MRVAGRDHPSDEGQQGSQVNHRRVQPGSAVRDAPIGRAAGLGRFHHARHLRKERILRSRGGHDRQRSRQVERAGLKDGALGDRLREAFAGDQGAVELRASLDDARIHRHAFAGGQQDGHARLDLVHGKIAVRSVRLQDERAACGEPGETLDRRTSPFPHHVIERAADQQKEQQRNRGIEIGVRPVVDRLVQAHPEGEENADRDRHIHVGPAPAEARQAERKNTRPE